MNDAKALSRCHSIMDLRERARRRLPFPIFEFLDGASETEETARGNTAAFDDERLVPRCLVGVTAVNTRVRVLGQDLDWPVFCSPTGASRLFHPDGELAVARAASHAGTLYSLSTGSTYGLEEVAAASAGPKMFQVYIWKNRDLTLALIERARQVGFAALCVTVDVPAIGKRERDLRSGFSMPPKWSLQSASHFARHPGWLVSQMRRGRLTLPNLDAGPARGLVAQSQRAARELDPALTWRDIRAIADAWGGPLAIKGVMSADDAQRAVDTGATAVIVSNHGGRQLDGAAAPYEVLPEIARAVGDRAEVILDGGVRRGVHVLKALARGARACSVGRPYLYGLGAGGEAGVSRALEILRGELVLAMQLAGCADARCVDRALVRRFP
jgi:L-lactate dehydrogenase (cytochrome)